MSTVSASSFTGTFNDYGRDTDSDGLFNSLIIEAEVIVDSAPQGYGVFGMLEDSKGNMVESISCVQVTETGKQNLILDFEGIQIFGNMVNGPYYLTYVELSPKDCSQAGGTPPMPPESYRYDAHTTNPYLYTQFEKGRAAFYCGISPCTAPQYLIRSRDNLNTPEPNSPNTIDTCKDGSSGEYLHDESIERITVTSLSNSFFKPGDTVNVYVQVYCDSTSDSLNFVYSNDIDNIQWEVKDSKQCSSTGLRTLSTTFSLDNKVGRHAIRGVFGFELGEDKTCGNNDYDDNDDIVIYVKGECSSDSDCQKTECDSLDSSNTGCYQGTYRDYHDVLNMCGSDSTCTMEECASYTAIITDADKDGYDTECDNDCNDNNADVNPGKEEICNNIDDDCDGDIDEDLTRQTSCGMGACAGNTGYETCTAGSWGEDTCDPYSGAGEEVCEGSIDEDCDGLIDEDCTCTAGEERDCFLQEGVCEGLQQTCNALGKWEKCDYTSRPDYDTYDDCDGLDNDCDGTEDEDYVESATSCGIGICAAEGLMQCVNGKEEDSCKAGDGSYEICDNLDNDCDGTIDEDLTRQTNCGIGACMGNIGYETCASGEWGGDTCDPYYGASEEICDNEIDDDCDSYTDMDDTNCQEKYMISLKKGWNLISLPQTEDKDVEEVMEIFNDNADRIAAFKNGEWGIYDKSDILHSNLDEISESEGFWIRMDNEADVFMDKEVEETDVSLNLKKGWNMIGYPSWEERDVNWLFSNVMDDIRMVYVYDGDFKSLNPERPSGFIIKPGMGILVKAKNDVPWYFDGRYNKGESLSGLDFSEGWNLVSIPLESDKTKSEIFQGTYSDLYYLKNNEWMQLKGEDKIDYSYSYWVRADESSLQIEGKVINDLDIEIQEGWNMISYPLSEEKGVDEFFRDVMGDIDIIAVFEEGEWKTFSPLKPEGMNSLDVLKPGRGIFIKAKRCSGWGFDGEGVVVK
ncbi:hypothetical protein KY366_04215 [Candidatus Woesearchaeota archaeon]|nr:hypothetical protein [Candidatus Woesearchaeota archaeon]